MAHGVFVHRADSIYEDSPSQRYHFPAQYLGRANACVGDWILYYEPVKVAGTRGYFAVARVERIVPDPSAERMYFALIEPGSYLDFDAPIAFNTPGGLPIERGLLNETGRLSGRAQAAVRPISLADFNRIIDLALSEAVPSLPRVDLPGAAVREEQAPFVFEQERARGTALTSRLVRDRVFRKRVLHAYGERCAFTGLRLINGGGRAEAEAAHIRPVAANGPDAIGNGLALSGTVHWMFDRGLISLNDDLEILISRQANDPASIWGLINQSKRALVPRNAKDRPHPAFLAWHREYCFKQ